MSMTVGSRCVTTLAVIGVRALACCISAACLVPAAWALDGGASLFLAPHKFSTTNELGQPEGFAGGMSTTAYPGLRLSFYPLPIFGVELEGGAGVGSINSTTGGQQSLILATFRGHGIVRLPVWRLNALAIAGGGMMKSIADTKVQFASDTDPYSYAGFGLDYALNDRWRVRVDARVHFTGSTTLDTLASRDYEATVALGFNAATSRNSEFDNDADRDGIGDDADRCPLEPETKNGVRDDDGCPEDMEIAKRVHQTRFVAREQEQVAILPKEKRGILLAPPLVEKDGPTAAVIAAAVTVTSAEDRALASLDRAQPLATNALPPLVGPGDDDHDGVNRADDVCPDEAEDYDKFEDLDGCPDPDNDGDGIDDDKDVCPFEAETVNGVGDADGCPEDPNIVLRYHQTRYARHKDYQVAVLPDDASRITAKVAAVKPLPEEAKLARPEEAKLARPEEAKLTRPDEARLALRDEAQLALLPVVQPLAANALPPLVSAGDDDRDGLPRADDVCPDHAEDVDGFEDGDGCPDPDNDGDRVPDGADKCPVEGETANGYDDDDGCPDAVPIPLAVRVGVLQGVVFGSNSSIILPPSWPVLTKVVNVLVRYPQARVEISGHTDKAGGRELNLELSQQRAEAVRAWLVEKGAALERISAKGYGPDKPAFSNASAGGRAKNRRVEFNLVTAVDE
ncbi:MAG: OmpA family protein [Myxococcales bacterium]|nr:OmpA family protein [Myxococcales bacterium]